MTKSTSSRIRQVILFTLLIGVVDYSTGWPLVEQYFSSNYSSTTGKITHNSISWNSGGRGGKSYFPVLWYRYEVNGQIYNCGRYRYAKFSSRNYESEALQKIVADHPVGSEVQVFYNPEKPADAILSRDLSGYETTKLWFCILINLAIVVGWFFLVRKLAGIRSHPRRHLAAGLP